MMLAIAAFTGTGSAFAGAACCGGIVKEDIQAACCATVAQAETRAAACCGGATQAASLVNIAASSESQLLVKAYEQLSSAVFDGNIPQVKKASSVLARVAREQSLHSVAKEAEAVANAVDVNGARLAFVGLSREMIAAVEDQPGYYVMSCPMVKNGEWLQSSKELHNPYMGESMPRCGFVKRETGKKSEGV